ncbi:MAG: hypothetical protein HY082_03295 [Gammaproteobacteria bacterium]|nr:hypothetical protein [Gammaproteobacteria bacterium]
MHYIADYYLNHQAAAAPPGATAALLGALSLALYALLYQFCDELVQMAEATRRGDKNFFPVPIVLSLTFSLVHGAFTGHFWDMLGFKPKSG